jgi:HK97 family phage prohead protease
MATENTDYIKLIDPQSERRFVSHDMELRDDGNGPVKISGYAAVFEKDSVDFGGWVERVDPEAFSDVLNDDAFALFNHDPNLVLARNRVNMTLTVDKVGLRYSFDAPDTTVGKDLAELVRTGVINKSSFAFRVKSQEWTHSENPNVPSVRTIKRVARLYDVAPVTYPAYPDTSVGTRAFKQYQENLTPKVNWVDYINKISRIHSH